ncbi:MAG: hypothetical protein MUF18_04945 [Fimbriiglobus sp.]|jgi:hypothetical protein|nr:hypothetical protein [Fimbriiglobus sp.]
MKRLAWLIMFTAVVGCGGDTKPTPTAPISTPTPASLPKGKQVALPE